MPLYEYACADCDHRFEVLQRLGEGAEKLECPECGAKKVDKQFSTFASSSSGESTSASAPAGACGGGSGFT